MRWIENRSMTGEKRQEVDHRQRLAGRPIIEDQARRQVQTFFDELKNGTRNYRTVASLSDQVAQEYQGRAILELLQNAHDALAFAAPDDPRQVSIVLRSSPEPELLFANSGRPFLEADFAGICQLAQSPKDPNENVGNKGLGFRSVLELSTCPEVWSTAPAGGKVAFTFGFDPEVRERIARLAQRLADGIQPTEAASGTGQTVDWSQKQIEDYRQRLASEGINPAEEVNKYLSPYMVPRFLEEVPAVVSRLFEEGHVTVIRLPLDGGKTRNANGAIESILGQLKSLEESSMLFLRHLSVLRVFADEEHSVLTREVHSALPFSPPGDRQRVQVRRRTPDAGEVTESRFHLWSRVVGGPEDAENTKRIAETVHHLPNRWPEVRQVDVAIAVEETAKSCSGVYVIFLPTDKRTTVGAFLNAPFYGSLNRREINFDNEYNGLLLDFLADLILDTVIELVSGPPEPWRGRAVLDLLASPEIDDGESMTARLSGRASDRGHALDQLALILCDDGWRRPGVVRTMPTIPDDDPIGRSEWRRQARFAVASSELDQRRPALEALLDFLGGSPIPHDGEWADTLDRMAENIARDQAPATWDDFIRSVVSILPQRLKSVQVLQPAGKEPLAEARFLPTEDGRRLSASDDVQIFFRPRRGADDAAAFVESIPTSLKERVSFLNHTVKTHEGPQRQNTEAQKFLDGRFVQSFRREDLLRNVVIPSLPRLPVGHGSPEAVSCSDTLAWSLDLIGEAEQDSLLKLLSQLPVACYGGWFALGEGVFGPGWNGSGGEHLQELAGGLPEQVGDELMRKVLLPPSDPRWGVEVASRAGLFGRAGVREGLRLESRGPTRFRMRGSSPWLPAVPPPTVPQSAWDGWRDAVRRRINPQYSSEFEYTLGGVKILRALHHEGLEKSATEALSNLILASLIHWDAGWQEVTIRKAAGNPWSVKVASPLKHWLSTLSWLVDQHERGQQPLRQRWFVPASLLEGQEGRYRHLAPLSLQLAKRLAEDPRLLGIMLELGLNTYPTDENTKTGPELLEALAEVAEDALKDPRAMPVGGFDVFLGQVRHAWRHWDPDQSPPRRFLVETKVGRKRRTLSVYTADQLGDAFLPDRDARTRLLRGHGQPVIAMPPEEARSNVGTRIDELGARRASGLEESCLVDDQPAATAADGARALETTNFRWLPVVLLTLVAHGGVNPRGPTTKAWRDAAANMGLVRVRRCRSVEVTLVDAGLPIASSTPHAHWWSRGRILFLRGDVMDDSAYEEIAAACQAILDRQDLIKDLRLVLGHLAGTAEPTSGKMEKALERAEIDAESFRDIRLRWEGETSALVDRIRPVAKLLGVRDAGLQDAANDAKRLTAWLSENIPHWPRDELLSAARKSRDDFEMGRRAGMALGDVASLSKWNEALQAIGGQYEPVQNADAEEQARRLLDEAARPLRSFARHVARADPGGAEGKPAAVIFSEMNQTYTDFGNGPWWPQLCDEWSRRWWVVPLGAVLDALRARYGRISAAKPHLRALENVATIAGLRSRLEQHGVGLEPDPLETARRNQDRLDHTVRSVRELYESWFAKRGPDAIATPPALRVGLDDSKYLKEWPTAELLREAIEAVDDRSFRAACGNSETIEGLRTVLGITPENLERARQERLTRTREKASQQRMFEVAGQPYEIGVEPYSTLFSRLDDLPSPVGPPAHLDEYTPLDNSLTRANEGRNQASRMGRMDNADRTPKKTAHLHGSLYLPELVGLVGEMHAYRILRAEFKIDERAWVSEFRTKVWPPQEGEKDRTSDSLGYDFKFAHDGKTWCVEVKATTEDGTSFDLSARQIQVARELATKKDWRWRILRIRQAFNEQPAYDWLPNPFEQGASGRLRLLCGSMTVEYTPQLLADDDR